MRKRPRALPRLDIDPFVTACAFAGLAGVLSWIDPYFQAATVGIAALATLLGVIRLQAGRLAAPRTGTFGRVGTAAAFAVGWGAWLLSEHGSPSAGTVILGGSVVVAWWCCRGIRYPSEIGA